MQCEGPSVFKPAANSYFMMASHLTGWAPNPPLLFHATSDSLSGAVWLDSTVPASGVGANITFNSQSTFVFPLVLEDGTRMFIYMGDRWNFYGPGSVRARSRPHACMFLRSAAAPLNKLRWNFKAPAACAPSLARMHACSSAPLLHLSINSAGTSMAPAACAPAPAPVLRRCTFQSTLLVLAACVPVIPGCMHAARLAQHCCASQ